MANLPAELAGVRAALKQLESPEEKKLSAKAFLDEACRIARRTPAHITALADKLAADQGRTWPAAWAAVQRMTRQLRTFHWPAPTTEGRRLSYLGEGALAEGFSAFEIQAVAVALVARSHPDVFGKATSSDEWQERFRVLQAREQELTAALRAERQRLEAEAAALAAQADRLGV